MAGLLGTSSSSHLEDSFVGCEELSPAAICGYGCFDPSTPLRAGFEGVRFAISFFAQHDNTPISRGRWAPLNALSKPQDQIVLVDELIVDLQRSWLCTECLESKGMV